MKKILNIFEKKSWIFEISEIWSPAGELWTDLRPAGKLPGRIWIDFRWISISPGSKTIEFDRIYWFLLISIDFHWILLNPIDVHHPRKGALPIWSNWIRVGSRSETQLPVKGWRKVEIGKWFFMLRKETVAHLAEYRILLRFRATWGKVDGWNRGVQSVRICDDKILFFLIGHIAAPIETSAVLSLETLRRLRDQEAEKARDWETKSARNSVRWRL